MNLRPLESELLSPLLSIAHKDYKSSQVLVAVAESARDFHAALTAYSYKNGNWMENFKMPAVLGKNGVTMVKREGDRKTPAGIFRIGRAFGRAPKPEGSEMPYTVTTKDDYWIDDPDSRDYNKWVVYSGDPGKRWQSYEKLMIPEYEYAAVIEYNTHPIIKGKGSAVFMHVWSGPDHPTAGCTAVSEENMLKLLKWLRPSLYPVIIQGTPQQLKSYKK